MSGDNNNNNDDHVELMLHPNGEKLYQVNHLNIPALSMAPLMAMEPSLVAGTVARVPLKEPIGVRTALTMTTSWNQALIMYIIVCSQNISLSGSCESPVAVTYLHWAKGELCRFLRGTREPKMAE